MPANILWIVAVLALAFGLIALAGALLALRLRHRGMSLCLRLAGLDDEDLARLGPQELVVLDDELHDCAKQCDPTAASAISTVRQRINHILAKTPCQVSIEQTKFERWL